ncbi:hypothetical protein JCM3775_004332 [Rhodotorula graminis]
MADTGTSPLPSQADVPQDELLPTLPQWLATALIGPCMAGYQVAQILFGMYAQAMLRYVVSGDIKQHGRLALWTLYTMLLLQLIYVALTFVEVYTSGVSNDRTFNTVYVGTLQWQFLPWVNGIIGALAETFLAVRAASFFAGRTTKNLFYGWMGALVTLVLFGSTMTFATGVLLYNGMDDGDLPMQWNTAVAVWLWASTAADVSITAALTFNLRKRIAGFNRGTDDLLRNLVWLGVRSASYTALLSLLGALVATIWGDAELRTTEIQIAFWFPIAPLYGLSLLTTTSSGRKMINARVGSVSLGPRPPPELSGVFARDARSFGPRGGTLPEPAAGSGMGSAASFESGRRGGNGRPVGAPALQIKVEREVVHAVDDLDEDLSTSTSTSGPRADSGFSRGGGEKSRTRFEV